jgi:hypothetical protein
MAIVVEDGTGLSNADCYASVASMDAYLAKRNIVLTNTEAEKEAALVVSAQDWIDGQHSFSHERLTEDQALEFPRDNEIGLPEAIVTANIKAAHMQIQGLLMVDYSTLNKQGVIASESKSVGPLDKSTTYESGTAQYFSRLLPVDLTNLLLPYLSAGGFGRIYRVL